MHRDIDRLSASTFDVLVVGGGIYGLTLACDAAQRGLSVALVERNDFGSGASFNHLRTIHGGLRYLQTLDIARARESIRERRTLAHIAPSAVAPMPFVLPLTQSLTQGRLAMRAGFLLDAVIGNGRNRGLSESHYLPPGRVIGRRQALKRFPALNGVKMTGAAIWHDYVTTDADRLTLAWGLAATGHGAVLANYVEATALRRDAGRVVGVRAHDRLSGRSLEIAALVTVIATGPAVDSLLRPAGLATALRGLKAMNLVTKFEAPPEALGGRSRTGRTIFTVPWKGRALVGTWESSLPSAADDLIVRESDVVDFIADINHAFPSMALRLADLALVHRGVVPATVRPDGSVALEGHEQVVDHASRGAEGLVSVAGAKYTTARAVAERVTNRIVATLRRSVAPCQTAETPLPFVDLTGDALLAHAARNEMVVTLEDAVVRRTPLGALGYPGDAPLAHAAEIVGDALGWDQAKRIREIALVGAFYRYAPLGS